MHQRRTWVSALVGDPQDPAQQARPAQSSGLSELSLTSPFMAPRPFLQPCLV